LLRELQRPGARAYAEESAQGKVEEDEAR